MGETKHHCPHCGGGGFWNNFFEGLRRRFKVRRRADRFEQIKVRDIDDNPYQPRTYVLTDPHDNLKMSVAQYGVIVPIIINRKRGGRYTLVAGQRRLMAARELGMDTVPAFVRSLNTKQVMEVTHLENLHREALSPVDVVKMFDRLQRKHPELTDEELAVSMGLDIHELDKSRRMLKLPIPALEAFRAGMINEAQADMVAEIEDSETMLEAIEVIYQDQLDGEAAQALVDRMLKKPARFISADASPHFHSSSCPYAYSIPEEKKDGFYSKGEAKKRGKIPCMNCL